MSLKYVFEILKLAKVVGMQFGHAQKHMDVFPCPRITGCNSDMSRNAWMHFYVLELQDVIRTCPETHGCVSMSPYLFTRAPAPPMIPSTSSLDAIDVSPGVVIARAPCAAP